MHIPKHILAKFSNDNNGEENREVKKAPKVRKDDAEKFVEKNRLQLPVSNDSLITALRNTDNPIDFAREITSRMIYHDSTYQSCIKYYEKYQDFINKKGNR